MNATSEGVFPMSKTSYEIFGLRSDPRSDRLVLMRNGPGYIVTIIGVYLLLSIRVGPQLMKNRKPFELRNTLLAYNCFMVFLNVYFFARSLFTFKFGKLLLEFQFPTDYDNFSEDKLEQVSFCHLYLLSKLLDFMDTFFFVLRKKSSQLTPLHLYHHASVPFCVWLAVAFAPTAGVNGIFPIFNSLVHVVMYSYYALSAMGPAIQKYLWWKKYITQIQLVQFIIFFFYGGTYFFYQTNWPRVLMYTAIAQPPLYLVMFFSFYIRSYCLNEVKTKKNKWSGFS